MLKKTIITIVLSLIPLSALRCMPPPSPSFSPEEEKSIVCLAKNIYFEAGSESLEGKRAVSQVIINRLNDPRFPKSICEIVYQQKNKVYQFSWASMKKKIISNEDSWFVCLDVAIEAIDQSTMHKELADKNALFFHADYINPGWKFRKVGHIGKHIFYTDAKKT